MASSLNADNGVVSGTAGLKSSADNSGVLDLQTNGTTAISISASQVVTFANQPAYTGGTANGVLYLNASKVLTSGSALVFDGTNLGIGASTPLKPLDVSFASGARRFLVSYDDSVITIKGAGSTNAPEALRVIGDTIRFNTGVTGSGSEAARIDSSGRIGFGSQGTSSDRLLGASFQGATTSGSTQFGIVFNPTYPNTATVNLFNVYSGPNLTAGTTVTNVFGYYLEAINAAGSTVTNRYGIYQAGASDNNVFAGNVTVNNGITFPATQVASANANTLDDYEEGTFAVAISPSSGAFGSVTYNANNATYYTKVGRLVSVTGIVWVSSYTTGTASGRMFFSLPFSAANVTQNFSPGVVMQFGGNGYTPSIATANVAARAEQGSAVFSLGVDNNTVYTDEQIGTFSASGFLFRFNITYITT